MLLKTCATIWKVKGGSAGRQEDVFSLPRVGPWCMVVEGPLGKYQSISSNRKYQLELVPLETHPHHRSVPSVELGD